MQEGIFEFCWGIQHPAETLLVIFLFQICYFFHNYSCECKPGGYIRKQQCRPPFEWHSSTCSCKCRLQCQSNQIADNKNCRCMCKQETYQRCIALNRNFDIHTCQCLAYGERATGQKGKFHSFRIAFTSNKLANRWLEKKPGFGKSIEMMCVNDNDAWTLIYKAWSNRRSHTLTKRGCYKHGSKEGFNQDTNQCLLVDKPGVGNTFRLLC